MLEHEHRTADYVIRILTFTFSDTGVAKRVKHFQFLSWPVKRITPACPTVFLQFMKAVNKTAGIKKDGTRRPLVSSFHDLFMHRKFHIFEIVLLFAGCFIT